MRSLLHRLRFEERGQSAIEFGLVLPLLVTFVFLITELGRTMDAYNDATQIAATAARYAAVNNKAAASNLIRDTSDTKTVRDHATLTWSYPSVTCNAGDPVQANVSLDVTLFRLLGVSAPIPVRAHAQMRLEQALSGGCT